MHRKQLKWNQYDQYIFTQPGWELAVHVLVLVLNWDSSVSSTSDSGISSQIFGAKEERLSVP